VILDRATYKFEWGKAVELEDGEDITLIGTGVMSVLARESSLALRQEGIRARVLHVHTLKPLDEEAILKAARETAGIVTLENHSIIGGLGGAVAELLCERQPARMKRIGFPDVFGESGDDNKIFAKMGLSVENVVRQAKLLLRAGRDSPTRQPG
jgi:transketolase